MRGKLFTGIDVSAHQGKIDWEKVKDETDFVIIRCGFGGDYPSQDDLQWEYNVAACEKYGIPYGVYLYSYATTIDKVKSEAEHAIRLLRGHKPDMPVFYDLEEARISALGNARILEAAKTFCSIITSAGYLYGTYANKNWFCNYLTDEWYDKYPKWIAQYSCEVTYQGKYDIWQYTDSGSVNGIRGKVDMNISYSSFLRGDADRNGKITAADGRKILRASAGLDSLTPAEEHIADVNGDGNITASDAYSLLKGVSEVK